MNLKSKKQTKGTFWEGADPHLTSANWNSWSAKLVIRQYFPFSFLYFLILTFFNIFLSLKMYLDVF